MPGRKWGLGPTVRFAWKEIIPLLISYVVVGLAFGLLTYEAGYPLLWCFLCSTFVYAGSMQIVMLSLMASGVPLPFLAVMTLFVNARHIFYGLGFIERFRAMGRRYPYMALTVTDETYSAMCAMRCPEGVTFEDAGFVMAVTCHLLWIVSTSVGSLLGQVIPIDLTGIEFCVTGYFITVCVEQWKAAKSHIPVLTGAVSAVLFWFLLGPENFLLPALSVSFVTLLILRKPIERKEAAHE